MYRILFMIRYQQRITLVCNNSYNGTRIKVNSADGFRTTSTRRVSCCITLLNHWKMHFLFYPNDNFSHFCHPLNLTFNIQSSSRNRMIRKFTDFLFPILRKVGTY